MCARPSSAAMSRLPATQSPYGMPDRSREAVIGDNLEADIAGGLAAGIVTILVLTGNTDRACLAASLIQPDIVLEDLSGLLV
jgi:ribonucleotide monophosphatase NagD (HAD superfamily)